jgi:hypothetical protein
VLLHFKLEWATFSREFPRRPTQTLDKYINDTAAAVLAEVSATDLQARLKPGGFADWSLEGLELATKVAYPAPPVLERGKKPSPTYREAVFEAAKPAAVLAGLRLGDMLNRSLVPSTPSGPPDGGIERDLVC